MINIIAIDDQPIVLHGIKSLIDTRDDMKVLACCNTGYSGMESIEKLAPQVVLLDIDLPDMDGAELCRQIRKKSTERRIIVLSFHNESAIIKNILKNGANAYVLKTSSIREIILAIQTSIKGHKYLCSKTKALMHDSTNLSLSEIPRITRREQEIMKLVSKGFTTGQIAKKLFISPHTVESHRKNLIEKFDAASMMAVINLAVKYRIM
ncbi:response regulator [Flavobacterium tistrianum]|uniref:response regulator n=1 Tax=Flavobacterium tistrianum TaxID=1685414 RepID=UPI000DAC1717|nr:response regulator transcription factor [Flavobacterium tistrianum]KAF2340408.1 response regulator transcription factor [Flavobacterium tistrianum]